MKPHPAIFRTALERMNVEPGAAVMVGDSLVHDVEGARRVGMRGVWLVRGGAVEARPPEVPMISTLRELPGLLGD